MIKKLFSLSILVFCFLAIVSCSKDDDNGNNTPVNEGDDPNFKIVANTDEGFSSFSKKVEVFGIDIYAVSGVDDDKLLYAANVMAQYLDNDEDGTVDNQLVLDKLLENKAYLVMWKKENDLDVDPPSGRLGQDLGNDETNPTYVSSGLTERFDAALEEVLHLINSAGHAYAYPSVFGLNEGSELADAMDIARGGKFLSIPSSYPDGAWYTYSDQTCEYADCQTIEYLYWALTSVLGAQNTSERLAQIQDEWKLNTKEKVQNTDTSIYSILTNPEYKMPTVLPDGTYMR